MSKAKEVLNQINKHYTVDDQYHVNLVDIQVHLKNNMVDQKEQSVHQHSGFESSDDGTMAVFFYPDGSAILVNTNGGMTIMRWDYD